MYTSHTCGCHGDDLKLPTLERMKCRPSRHVHATSTRYQPVDGVTKVDDPFPLHAHSCWWSGRVDHWPVSLADRKWPSEAITWTNTPSALDPDLEVAMATWRKGVAKDNRMKGGWYGLRCGQDSRKLTVSSAATEHAQDRPTWEAVCDFLRSTREVLDGTGCK